MTPNINILNEVSSSNKSIGRKVHLSNGQTTSISYTGSCTLLGGDILKNILVLPDFKFDLLLVSHVTR